MLLLSEIWKVEKKKEEMEHERTSIIASGRTIHLKIDLRKIHTKKLKFCHFIIILLSRRKRRQSEMKR